MIQPTQLALALHSAQICYIGHGHQAQYPFIFAHVPLHFRKPLPIVVTGNGGKTVARIAQTVEGEDVMGSQIQ